MAQAPNEQNQEVEKFLTLFGGNTERAELAIAAYEKNKIAHEPAPTGMDTPLSINLANVKKFYKTGKGIVRAVDGVSLQIYQGEFVAITGASGSGKSTLLQLIGGLDKPTEGSVEVAGVELQSLRDSALAEFRGQTIGFVFQFFYLQPFLQIGKNIEVTAMFARNPPSERRSRVGALAHAVGITDQLGRFPRELSGGQMQRAAIARALMNQPKILLADEPTGNLDSTNGRSIIDLFEKIRQDFGTTVVIVTHDARIAARADREIILKDGVIAP